MAVGARFTINMPRNADYQRTWRLRNKDGTAFNLTGYTMRMSIKKSADVNASSILDLEIQTDDTISGFKLVGPATDGLFTTTIILEDVAGEGVRVNEENWTWDWVLRKANGIRLKRAGGNFVFEPAVGDPLSPP